MKKLVCCIMLLLLCACLFCGAAMAEEPAALDGGGGVIANIPKEPFTWEYLATIAGATVLTVLIVQLLKLPLDKIGHIPTRIIVYMIALIIGLLSTLFTTGLTLPNALLSAVNAVIVALAAMGGYELTFKKLEK